MSHIDELNFGFVFQDLIISRSLLIEVDSGDPTVAAGHQEYNSIEGGYYPDYTIFPLVLSPIITATDPDETGLVGSSNEDVPINKDLANMKWTVKEAGQPDLMVTNTMGDYEVETVGENLGRLTVKRNITPGKPLTFVFDAEYLDPRTDDVRTVHLSHTLYCAVTIQQSVLKLDIPPFFQFNPIEATERTVHATVINGDQLLTAAQCRCKWQLREGTDDNGRWVDFDKADVPLANRRADMLFGIVSDDTLSFDIRMDAMAKDETFRCVAYVGADAAELAMKVEADDNIGFYTFRIKRDLPQYNAKIEQTPKAIPKGQDVIYPKAVAQFRNYSGGTDPQKLARLQQEVEATWETARGMGTSGTTPTYAKVAEGFSPEIRADKVNGRKGQQVRLTMKDRGQWRIATTGNGTVLTTGDGKPLLIRSNQQPT